MTSANVRSGTIVSTARRPAKRPEKNDRSGDGIRNSCAGVGPSRSRHIHYGSLDQGGELWPFSAHNVRGGRIPGHEPKISKLESRANRAAHECIRSERLGRLPMPRRNDVDRASFIGIDGGKVVSSHVTRVEIEVEKLERAAF